MKITTIGLDIAKSVFHAVGVDKAGKLIKKKMLRRKDLLPFVAQIEPCLIVMEACSGANYWTREFELLGHSVKLIAPQFVVPFRQGNKNDYNDALAIAEAAQRPNMRFVKPKSVEQQDVQLLHRMRERLTKQSTALINQVRGMLAEYGIVIAKSKSAFKVQFPEILTNETNALTTKGRTIFYQLYEEFTDIERRLKDCDTQVLTETKNNVICQRLETIPGIGPVYAAGLLAEIGQIERFEDQAKLAKYAGLTWKVSQSGNFQSERTPLTKTGNRYFRYYLIEATNSVRRHLPEFKTYYQKKYKEVPKHQHKRALVLTARKFVRLVDTLLRNHQLYTSPRSVES